MFLSLVMALCLKGAYLFSLSQRYENMLNAQCLMFIYFYFTPFCFAISLLFANFASLTNRIEYIHHAFIVRLHVYVPKYIALV